ncbi:MAG: hypothetical protein FJY55_01940 [Betaproteobacteria bacterium]|nr:hypothetical protein [Betaproteobacteria bacterium]
MARDPLILRERSGPSDFVYLNCVQPADCKFDVNTKYLRNGGCNALGRIAEKGQPWTCEPSVANACRRFLRARHQRLGFLVLLLIGPPFQRVRFPFQPRLPDMPSMASPFTRPV